MAGKEPHHNLLLGNFTKDTGLPLTLKVLIWSLVEKHWFSTFISKVSSFHWPFITNATLVLPVINALLGSDVVLRMLKITSLACLAHRFLSVRASQPGREKFTSRKAFKDICRGIYLLALPKE